MKNNNSLSQSWTLVVSIPSAWVRLDCVGSQNYNFLWVGLG